MRELRDFLAISTLFAANLYYSLQKLFHAAYDPSLYKGFVVVCGIVSMLVCVWELLNQKIRMGITFWMMGVFLPVAFVIELLFERSTSGLSMSFINFMLTVTIASCFPAIFVGIYIAQRGLDNVAKWLDIIHPILTLAPFITIITAQGTKVWMGMANYQYVSYQAAFCFCLAVCYIMMGEKMNRFAICKARWYRYVEYILMLMSLVACIGSGGRGGFLLIVLGTGYMLYVTGRLTRMLGSGLVVMVFLYMLSSTLGDTRMTSRFNYGATRVFSYINDDGSIDVHSTSGREVLMEGAWNYAKSHNFMGTGLLRADQDFQGYPHNFELEVLAQGGVLFLIFWIIILLYVNKHCIYLSTRHNEYLILPLVAYPMVYLQASGTYLQEPLFWFCVTYAFARIEQVRIEEMRE